MFLYMLMYKLHVKLTQKCMQHAMIPKYILTPNLGFLPQIIYRYALSSTLLQQKPEVKVRVTCKQLVTLQGPRCIYIPIWNATINKMGDLLWVHFFKNWLLRSRSQWMKTASDIPWLQHISTNWIWGLIWHIIWDMRLQGLHRPGKNWPWSWKKVPFVLELSWNFVKSSLKIWISLWKI